MPKRKTKTASKSPIYVLLVIIILTLVIIPLIYITQNRQSIDPRSRAAVGPEQFLRAQGSDLVYKGQKVILRGVNFDNIGALGAGIGSNNVNDMYYNAGDYQLLKSYGGNHVRLGLSYTWWANNRAQFYLKVDEQVKWARENNIFLLLLNFINPDGGDGCYEGYGNHCSMWGNTTYQQQLENMWIDIATRYKDEPAVIGYDLVNEPTPPGPNWCSTWFTYAQKLIHTVTDAAPNQLIFIESCDDPSFSRIFTNKSGSKATNVVYEMHDYAPMAFSHPGYNASNGIKTYPGNATAWIGGVERSIYWDKSTFAGTRYPGVYSSADATLVNWGKQNGVPVYVGEWGAQSWTIGYTQYIKDKGEVFTDVGVHHAYYTWKHDIDTGWRWGMMTKDGRKDQAKIEAVKASLVGSVQPNFDSSAPLPTLSSATATPMPTTGTVVTATPRPTTAPNQPTATVRPQNTPQPTARPTNVVATPTKANVPAPTNVPSPAGVITTSNPKIGVLQTKPSSGQTAYLRAQIDPSVTTKYVAWYVDGKWAGEDRTAPYTFGSETNGYTFAKPSSSLRVVVYYDLNQRYIDGTTTYTVGSGSGGQPPAPTANPVPATGVSADITVTNEWQQGYCAQIVVRNGTSSQIANWRVVFNMNDGKSPSAYNGSFVTLFGKTLVTPNSDIKWLPANGTNNAVDYCATKTGTNWRPTGATVLQF